MIFENRADGGIRKTTRLSLDQEGEFPMSFFQKLREEKKRMYPLNRFLTYTVAPIYVVVCILLFAGAAIVLSIDENRFLPLGIGLMGGFVLVSVAVCICTKMIRRLSISRQMDSYDFDPGHFEDAESWDYCEDGRFLRFDRYGMYTEDGFFPYEELHVSVLTDVSYHVIRIAFGFFRDEEHFEAVRFDGRSVRMVRTLNIRVEPPEAVESILENKAEVFRHLYDRGYLYQPDFSRHGSR